MTLRRTLRILIAADVPDDPNSGAGGTMVQIAAALRRLGHIVDTIWTGDLTHRIRHGNLRYLIELPWSYHTAVSARTKENSYDVIEVSQPHGWLAAKNHHKSGRPGVFVNRSHGWEGRATEALSPWRLKFHEPEWRFPRGALGRPLRASLARYETLAVHHSDGVLTCCSDCAEFVRQRHSVARERVESVSLGPPGLFLDQAALPMTEERLKGILYVGQFAFFKAPQVLAAVFNRLVREQPGVRLTWCCASQHHKRVRSLLSEEARFAVNLVGWRGQAELMELYDQNGIFLFPSFFEGFGKAFIEAMARGLCVVASDTGGMNDVIVDGDNGALTPIGSVERTLEEVSNLLDRPDRAARIAAAARRTALGYNWDRVAEETLDFYWRLLAKQEMV